MLPAPRICCLDLDTFFVSVERLLDPRLIGKPVVVGGLPGQRGVVTAASYEVRAFGVRSGISLKRAFELAPQAIFLPTRHGAYEDYAARVRDIARRYTPVAQVASIDEMFLDFSGCERLYARPGDRDAEATIERTVRALAGEIQERLGLPASAGIGSSRPVAKIASALAKPRGVLLVRAGTEADFLAPLPVRRYPGIGPVAEQALRDLGIGTLGELAAAPSAVLRSVFGGWADTIQRGSRGQAPGGLGRERPAFREHDPAGAAVGSLSNERTFDRDVSDPARLDAMLCALCERVCWRARKRGIKGRTVTLALRYADFRTLSRSRSLPPTSSELELLPVLRELLARARPRPLPVRLLGVALSNLGPYDEQLPLFHGAEALHRSVDAIRARYGYEALQLALGSPPGRQRPSAR